MNHSTQDASERHNPKLTFNQLMRVLNDIRSLAQIGSYNLHSPEIPPETLDVLFDTIEKKAEIIEDQLQNYKGGK